jgi:hypothetical protein
MLLILLGKIDVTEKMRCAEPAALARLPVTGNARIRLLSI